MHGGHFEFPERATTNPIYAPAPTELPDWLTGSFYHVTDLPGYGSTSGCWDLRGRVPDYLGFTLFDGRRVLEIGPASGFLTNEMEKLGAEVVCVEVTDDHGWDFVPFPASVLTPEILADRRMSMQHMKLTFWFTHRACRMKARLYYGDVYNLPDELGKFDIALLGAVLLHTENPQRIIAECAKRADKIIITEPYFRDLDGMGPLIRLYPTADNKDWATWWQFTPAFFHQYLKLLGFTNQLTNYHKQLAVGQNAWQEYFTVVASRPKVV